MTKPYFRGLPKIGLVSGLIDEVYELQDDENLKKVLKARLLSVYRLGFEPGVTAWEALKGLHEYILENNVDKDSTVSYLFEVSIKRLKEDEIKRAQEENGCNTQDESLIDRFRHWTGKYLGPRMPNQTNLLKRK